MYICFTANLLNLHPNFILSTSLQAFKWQLWGGECHVHGNRAPVCGARFSSGRFAAWLCMWVEQAEEQQGWVQGAQPLVITSITATAGEWETWMGGKMEAGVRLDVSQGLIYEYIGGHTVQYCRMGLYWNDQSPSPPNIMYCLVLNLTQKVWKKAKPLLEGNALREGHGGSEEPKDQREGVEGNEAVKLTLYDLGAACCAGLLVLNHCKPAFSRASFSSGRHIL